MSALVNNLLDMARLQSGDVKINRDWQPLEEVIGVALQSRAHLLARHTLKVEIPADLPLLYFDPVLMERVFCNLLENAAKYTPPGSSIRLSARSSGDWVEIRVEDNGPGLPEGKEEAVFAKFTRGKNETAVTGVGLGLSHCPRHHRSPRWHDPRRKPGGRRGAFHYPPSGRASPGSTQRGRAMSSVANVSR